ncbi:hypothetical protein B1964_25250 [Gordonia sp. i37]|nr:hypothetical protein B1964_25250 [Gordonia sp. i37]
MFVRMDFGASLAVDVHSIAFVSAGMNQSGDRGSFVSISEVAKIYGVHPTTVRRWIMEGRIEAQRVGSRLIRLDLESVYRKLGRPTSSDA